MKGLLSAIVLLLIFPVLANAQANETFLGCEVNEDCASGRCWLKLCVPSSEKLSSMAQQGINTTKAYVEDATPKIEAGIDAGITGISELYENNKPLFERKLSQLQAFYNELGPDLNKTTNYLLNKFDETVPILKEAGFTVKKLRVEMALIPKISIYIHQEKRLNHNQQQQVLKNNEASFFSYTMLTVLFKAHSLEYDRYELKESILQLYPLRASVFLQPLTAGD